MIFAQSSKHIQEMRESKECRREKRAESVSALKSGLAQPAGSLLLASSLHRPSAFTSRQWKTFDLANAGEELR
jgi:hypothetical protein